MFLDEHPLENSKPQNKYQLTQTFDSENTDQK